MIRKKWIFSILIFYNFISCDDNDLIRVDKDILNGWDM